MLACVFSFSTAMGENALGNTGAVQVASNNAGSSYMALDLDEGYYYQSNLTAGTVTGDFDNHIIGTADLGFSASVNEGFQLVGWLVTDSDGSYVLNAADASLDATSGSYMVSKKVTADSASYGTYTAYFTDSDSDGLYDASTLALDKVYDSISINPIYDYIYYDVDLTELSGVVDHFAYSKVELSSWEEGDTTYYTYLYYKTTTSTTLYTDSEGSYNTSSSGDCTTATSYTLYTDCLLMDTSTGSYLYFPEVYVTASSAAYTLQQKATSSTGYQLVELDNGAYRLGADVNIDFSVLGSTTSDFDTDLANAKNINLTAAYVAVGGSYSTLSIYDPDDLTGVDTYLTITKDSYDRTTAFSMRFVITSSTDRTASVSIDYDTLYVASIKMQLDSTDISYDSTAGADNTIYNMLIENITISYYYSIISATDGTYFVRTSSQNGNYSLRISCASSISQTLDNVSYVYYNFASLDSSTSNTSKNYSTITKNFDITIAYTSQTYNISFEFRLYENGSLSAPSGSFNLLEAKALSRGLTLTILSADIPANTGYTFYGFTLDESSVSKFSDDSYTVTISEDTPADITVYLVYTYTQYTLTLNNFNQISLTNTSKVTSYPLNKIDFARTKGSTTTTYTYYASDLMNGDTPLNTITYSTTLTINDILSFTATTNNGFKITGYSLDGSTYTSMTSTYYFTLTAAIIETLTNNTLAVYIHEDYQTYTLTYYTDLTFDSYQNSYVYMATLGYSLDKIDTNYQSKISVSSTTTNGVIYQYTISGLRLYDVLDITAQGKSDTYQSDNYTYSFLRFTSNDRVNLSFSSDSSTPAIYTHSETITGDTEIRVVFTMPSSILLVSVLSGYEDAYTMYTTTVDANQVETTTYNFTLYNNTDSESVEVISDQINLISGNSYTLTIYASYINFGYEFSAFSCSTNISSGSSYSIGTTTMTFTFTADTSTQYVYLGFNVTNFYLYIMQEGGGSADGTYVQFSGLNYLAISVTDLDIEFTLPTNYYVSAATFNNKQGGADLTMSDMVQDNDYSGLTFSYSLSATNLEQLVNSYAYYNTETSTYSIYLTLTYTIHTYDVKVEYSITNAKGNSYDNRVSFPSIKITYTLDGETSTVSGYVLDNLVYFIEGYNNGIPYGATGVYITATGSTQTGVTFYGWTDIYGIKTGYTCSSDQLIIGDIGSDIYLVYSLSYVSYYISVVVLDEHNYGVSTSSMGTPIVTIAGSQTTTVTLYDVISINSNPSLTAGFTFDYFYHYAYVEYVYDETSWASTYGSLYVLASDGSYTLNTSSTYDDTTTYYDRVRQEYDSSSVYTDTFLVSSYEFSGNTATIYLVYKYIEFTITNSASLSTSTTLVVSGSDLNLSPSDFCTFEVIIVDANGKQTTATEGVTTFTVNYTVYVYVDLKSNVYFSNDGNYYDLSMGVSLNGIYMLAESFEWSVTATGHYVFSFSVADILDLGVPEDGALSVDYRFLVKNNFTTTITTNISSTEFYGVSQFYMSYTNIAYGFSGVGGSDSNSSSDGNSLTSTMQFLGKTYFSYTIGAEYYTADGESTTYFFQISALKVYVDGSLISTSSYSKYGIMVYYNTDGTISHVDVRVVANVTLELQVTPVLYYNGYSSTSNGNYYFSSSYQCEEVEITVDGVTQTVLTGVSQSLSVGTSASDNIQTSSFILAFMSTTTTTADGTSTTYNVAYYDSNGDLASPEDVGTYTVKITFNSTGTYSWLSEIDLSYNIYFEITQKEIYVGSTLGVGNTLTKTYDGTSSYSVSNLLQYLTITDNVENGLNLAYSSSQFTLSQTYSALITYTYNNMETQTSAANESTSYNITISGLELTSSSFNSNYIIKTANSTLVIYNAITITRRPITLTGLTINDKVYDGTTTASISADGTLGLYGTITGTEVYLVSDNISLEFSSAAVGSNKTVVVDSSNALGGADAGNYYISSSTLTATIYPYSVSCEVDGYGTITLFNERGLTDASLVSLIPIGATLSVSVIVQDEAEYRSLYQYFSRFISNRETFAVGYTLTLKNASGVTIDINTGLYVSLPNVSKVAGAIYLTGEQAGELEYSTDGSAVIIDLSQMSLKVNSLLLTQQRTLFKWWQIMIIVVMLAVVVGLVVTIYLIRRKKSKDKFALNDKI